MRSASPVLLAAALCACGGGGSSTPTCQPVALPLPAGANVMKVTVNGSLCANTYPNKPCVSVKVCAPGTSTCQAVTDLLLDTGSVGLRVFREALTVPLTTGTLAECIQYIGGTSQWGPVATADVYLGGEPKVTVPIQIIDRTFGSFAAAGCPNPDGSAVAAGFNGILGVGLWLEDCGTGCAQGPRNIYFTCSPTSCSGAAVPLDAQVQNPVAHLPGDNNGVIVSLPAVGAGGTCSADGFLLLGIGTQSNNALPGAVVYPTDAVGYIQTDFGGLPTAASFLDTGSNGLFFNAPAAPSPDSVTACTGSFAGWYCQSPTKALAAVNRGTAGTPSGNVSFDIGNAAALQNNVFGELGGSGFGGTFDWGLPFFLGKAVAIGIEGRAALGSTGPFYAY